MTAAYHGSLETRSNQSYWEEREVVRLEDKEEQDNSDAIRLDGVMARIRIKRASRTSIPSRNDEVVSRILIEGEHTAAYEHREMLNAQLTYSSPSDFLGNRDVGSDSVRKNFDHLEIGM